MASLSVHLEPTLLERVNEAVKKYGFTKQMITENALTQYLNELEEDRQDTLQAEKAWYEFVASGKKTISSKEMWAFLDDD